MFEELLAYRLVDLATEEEGGGGQVGALGWTRRVWGGGREQGWITSVSEEGQSEVEGMLGIAIGWYDATISWFADKDTTEVRFCRHPRTS